MTRKFGSISKQNGYNVDAYTYVPVAILGAGESGIAMGCRLKEELGFDQFRVFERQAGIGGTWWINRYPGIACDVPAVFYSYSFCPNPGWSKLHPSGPEIVEYLQGICERYEIVDKIQLNSDVKEVRWLEAEKEWEMTIHHLAPGMGDLSSRERDEKIAAEGERGVVLGIEIVRAKIIASAVGGLVEPNPWPDSIPGKESFEGEVMHTARWNDNVKFDGKDVVVIGTGCSAAQVIPRLTEAPYNAKSVTQLMRSPPWVMPPLMPPDAEKRWEKWTPILFSNIPGLNTLTRFLFFSMSESDWFKIFPTTESTAKNREKIEKSVLKWMKTVVPEEYHEVFTPNYSIGGKRRIFDPGQWSWLASFQKPNVSITTQPLTAVEPRGVTVGPGRLYPDPSKTDSKVPTDKKTIPADVIILANGFETNNWLSPLKVKGMGGQDMHEVWEERGGAQAYLGIAMDGFPNFFMIFGPNTATGHSSVILATENTVNYSLKFMKPILNGDVETYEVKEEAEKAYTADIQKQLKSTIWGEGSCQSWYKKANGWNATLYPYSQIDFTYRCMFPNWSHWNATYTSRGLLKNRLRKVLKTATFAAAIFGLYKMRQQDRSLMDITPLIKDWLKSSLIMLKEFNVKALETMQSRL